MDEILTTYGQAILAGFSTIVLFMLVAYLFVDGLFAIYLDYVLNAIFG